MNKDILKNNELDEDELDSVSGGVGGGKVHGRTVDHYECLKCGTTYTSGTSCPECSSISRKIVYKY